MAVRLRQDGRILCAATHPEEPGDLYLHDGIHEYLACTGVLVTEAMFDSAGRGGHDKHGEWWWRTDVPEDAVLEDRERTLEP